MKKSAIIPSLLMATNAYIETIEDGPDHCPKACSCPVGQRYQDLKMSFELSNRLPRLQQPKKKGQAREEANSPAWRVGVSPPKKKPRPKWVVKYKIKNIHGTWEYGPYKTRKAAADAAIVARQKEAEYIEDVRVEKETL